MTVSLSASELDTRQFTALVVAVIVVGFKEMESITGELFVIVCDAVAVVVLPDKSVAVTIQSIVSPSPPIVEFNVRGLTSSSDDQ